MTIKFFLAIALIFSITACIGLGKCLSFMDGENQIHIKLADKILYSFLGDVKKDGRFWTEMSGGGMAGGTVNVIGLGLATIQHPSVEEARLIYVPLVEDFLHRLNSNEVIRPYLQNYPATIKNFELEITFKVNKIQKAVGSNTVAFMFPMHGKIFYSKIDSNTNRLADLYEETYEEALRIVREQHPELLPS